MISLRSVAFSNLLLAFASLGWTADCYVAPSGNDSNPGTQLSPVLTIAKALTVATGSGDRILLQRGGTWRETFTLGNGRQMLAYGSGEMPVITGSTIASFTGTSGSAKTVAVISQPLAVWIDGSFCWHARYPNKGANPEWLRIESGSTNNLIVDSGIKTRSVGRFTGAQVRWRRWSWWYETRTITNDNGSTQLTLANDAPSGTTGVNYANNSLGNSPDGQGSCYFIANDGDELDAPGEWFWSPNTLSVILPTGSTATQVEYALNTTPITISGATISGIAFKRFGGTALNITGASTVEDCLIEEVEDVGINLGNGSAGSTLRRNILRDIRNTGITVWQNTGGASANLIERNLLHRIGMERGYGGSGTWRLAGITLGNVVDATVRLNRIIDTGYAGIIVGKPNLEISNNILVRTMGTLNDGGAIYTNCNASTITGNIILDTVGDLSNSHPWWPLGHGIWPEFLSDFKNQVIEDNTVFGSNGLGIKLENNYTSSIQRNNLVGNRTGGLGLDVNQTTSGTNVDGVAENTDNDLRAQNHTIADNTIASVVPSTRIVRSENLNKWYLAPYTPPKTNLVSSYGSVDFGTMSNTTVITPSSGSDVFIATEPDRSWTTLAAWSTANSSWAQSSGTQATGNAFLLINDTEIAANLPVPAGTWTLPNGSSVSGTVAVQPFRSVVIMTTGSLPAAPYTVASSIDWRDDTPTDLPLLATPEMAVARGAASIVDGATDSITGTVNGQARSLSYTITNQGTSALILNTPVTLNATGCTLSAITQPSTSVTGGGTTTLAFTVTPSAAGAWSVTVSIANNDSNENPYNWTVSGTATATAQAEAELEAGETAIADGGTHTLSGTVIGYATDTTYTISNIGSASLSVSSAQITANVNCITSVRTAPAASVAIGASTNMTVRVTPSAGAWSCTVQFTCNDPSEGTYNWTISGTATAPAPEISVTRLGSAISSPDVVAAGGTAFSPLTVTYRVRNAGLATLNLGALLIPTAVNCGVPIVTDTLSTSIPAGSYDDFSVRITPQSNAAWSFSISFTTNDSDENPTTWQVQGTATAGGSGSDPAGGGGGGGGCSAGAASALLLAALGLGLRRRQRRI